MAINSEYRTLRERLEARFTQLRSERSLYENEWRLIQRYVAPRRGRMNPTERVAGRSKIAAILNNTCTDAVRVCANGLVTNLINPASNWFRLAPEDDDLAEFGEVRAWLDFVERRIYQILAKSGFYASATVTIHELVTFGTGAMGVERDYENISSWDPWTAGQYYLANNPRNLACTVYREWQMTVENMVAAFGLDRVSQAVKEQYQNGNPDHLVTIKHVVEPYSERFRKQAARLSRWPYVSIYYDPSDNKPDQFLRIGGFRKCPFFAPRWSLVPPDAYGFGPVQEALGDVSGLQVIERKIVKGIERKMGSSGWQGPPGSFNTGTLDGLKQGENDYNPVPNAIQIQPLIDPRSIQLQDAQWYHNEVRERIRQTCHYQLFRMFQDLSRRQMTATETIERAKEKQLLGPVLHQINTEFLQPVIDHHLTTLFEESQPFWAQGQPGMLPIPPAELQGKELRIDYISELQQAQRMSRAEPVYRLAAFVGEFAAIDPTLPMKIDFHQCADELAQALGAPPKVVRDDQTVMAMLEEQRAAQAEQQAMQQQAVEADTIQKLGSASTEPGTALGDLRAEAA